MQNMHSPVLLILSDGWGPVGEILRLWWLGFVVPNIQDAEYGF